MRFWATWMCVLALGAFEAPARAAVLRLAGVPNRARTLEARVTVVADGPKDYRLTLDTEVEGVTGERVLHGQSCHTVTDAAVVMMALILNPEVERNPPEPTLPPKPPAAGLPRSHAPHGFLASHIGLAVGILPHPVPEFGLGLGAALGPASLCALLSWRAYVLRAATREDPGLAVAHSAVLRPLTRMEVPSHDETELALATTASGRCRSHGCDRLQP